MPPRLKTTLEHEFNRHAKTHLSLYLSFNSCNPYRSLTKAANKIKIITMGLVFTCCQDAVNKVGEATAGILSSASSPI